MANGDFPETRQCDVLIAQHLTPVTGEEGDDLAWYVNNRVQLAPDLWVGMLRNGGRIVMACEPRGDREGNPAFPAPPFGAYYSVVRERPPKTSGFFKWDPDQYLRRAIVFSRLVHPTAIGYKYCASVTLVGKRPTRILPFPDAPAFGGDLKRPWLNHKEWSGVGELLTCWASSRASETERVNDAIWHMEMAALLYYLPIRWAVLGMAIEVLIGEWNGKRGRGARFREGLHKLATDCDIALTESDAGEAWNMRSKAAHGTRLPPPPSAREKGVGQEESVSPLFDLTQRVMASSLVRMIRDDDYAASFADGPAVKKWLDG